jgi:iron complex outermembrane receptor protein
MRANPFSWLRFLFLFMALALVASVLWAGSAVPEESDDAPTEGSEETDRASDESVARESGLTEKVEVTATRLSGSPEELDHVPAHVRVIEREQIEKSGVLTLQDLLTEAAGVVVYDQVGNDIQKTFDLRGFTRGTGTKVYLDGSPINDPRNNSTALELVPLQALERVEVTPGSAVGLAGGGSEAGGIHLTTARGAGDAFGGSLALAAGTYDTTHLNGNVLGGLGRFDYLVSGSHHETDGFRENAGGEVDRITGSFGTTLSRERRLSLSLLDSETDLGSPGALTLEELEDDPRQSPFNNEDFFDQKMTQASLNFGGVLFGRFTASANVFYRSQDSASFTSGRSDSEFSLETDGTVYGSTLQVTHSHETGQRVNNLTAGVEWLDGETDSSGLFSFGGIESTSVNTADRRTLALFVQDTLTLSRQWSVLVGVRADDDRIGFVEAGTTDTRGYSEVSFRAGGNWNPYAKYGFYASYGESFLPPTPEQLFAFPGFSGNPDLEPEDSRSFEVGFRGRWGPAQRLDVAAFIQDTENEIVFVIDPDTFIGRNENLGKTRRVGLEGSFRARPSDGFELFANLTLLDADLRSGPDAGNEVPLDPSERLAAGFVWELPAGFALHADGVYVGEQVLDGDESNEGPLLDDYSVVNARLSWSLQSAGGGHVVEGLTIFVGVRNLFDREYATRGIYVFDFTAGESIVFVTPAPDRRVSAGAVWLF